MVTGRSISFACVLALVVVCRPLPARAEDAARPVQLTYETHPGCPDALYFFWNTEQRTNRIRPAAPGELAASVSVTIERRNGQSAGTLEVEGDGVPGFTRAVEANTCSDVVQAMALVLALAFDPDALAGAPAAPEPAPVAAVRAPRVRAPVAEPRHERAAAGLQGAFLGAIAPSLRPVAGVFVAYQSLLAPVLRPRVELSLWLSPDDDFRGPSGRVTLGFLGAQLTACPVGARFGGGRFEAMPCVAFAAGQLVGEGDPALPVQHLERRVWSAVMAQGSLRWEITDRLFLQASSAVGVTLTRAEFVLDGARAYRVTPLTGELALGAGVHF
jgi:hypothetical protein